MSRPRSKIHPQQNTIVEMREEPIGPTDIESPIERNLDGELIHKMFLPLTISMRILGLHFEKMNKEGTKEKFSRYYCLFILVIMWLNAIRIFTIFTGDDKWQALFRKIGAVVWMVMSAVIQTSSYRACQNGSIQETLQSLNNDKDSRWAKHLRVRVIVYTVVAWIYTAFLVISISYALFDETLDFNVTIAPYNTLILNSSRLALTAMSTMYFFVQIYISGVLIFPLLWNYVLSSFISHEFEKCTKMIRDVVKEPVAAKSILEIVRCRHQALCRVVDKIDREVFVINATYLGGYIFLIILYVYTLMFNTDSASINFILCAFIIWVLSFVLGLIIVSRGAININQSAHKISERIQDIDLTNLSSEAIGQINAFLIRLSGEPIGFTVLRIFVIDRNTILTILGLLITYFLLIVQLFPTSTDSTENQENHSILPIVSTNEPPITRFFNDSTVNFASNQP